MATTTSISNSAVSTVIKETEPYVEKTGHTSGDLSMEAICPTE